MYSEFERNDEIFFEEESDRWMLIEDHDDEIDLLKSHMQEAYKDLLKALVSEDKEAIHDALLEMSSILGG